MKNLMMSFIFAFTFSGFSQSYVFCPELKTEEKQSLTDLNISIVFKDSRVYDKKLKEKCTKAEIFSEIVNGLRQTYPKVKITVLDENKFDEVATNDGITVKLDLQKYDATFYTGMYISNTKYEVKIFDHRNGNNIINEIISGEGKQWNAIGYTSGKIASNTSFNEAFGNLTVLLNNLPPSTNIPKPDKNINSQQNTITESKAERLRELKQLLDENILTQEEYDKEKKKILDDDK